MRRNTGSAILLCLALATTHASAQQQQALIPVGTLAAERRPITRAAEFVGRVEAMARVEIRARVAGKLAWLGVNFDAATNKTGGPLISTPESKVAVYVIGTNEELMIARHTISFISRSVGSN